MKYRPAQAQAGRRHRRQPRRPDLHRQLSWAQGGAIRVPKHQGEGGAVARLRRGQEDAVAAPRFGAPGRRHGHRPRAALACAGGTTRSDGCVQRPAGASACAEDCHRNPSQSRKKQTLPPMTRSRSTHR
jgi:hypothetical protein